LIRFLRQIIGLILIVIGIIASLSPIPFGFVLVVIGAPMALAPNSWTQKGLRALRRMWPWFDHRLDEITDALPDAISKPLAETDPPEEPPARAREARP